ncbi:MAG: aminotransferase class V-fold PLP-dependent enzyme [Terracidiphilus sp.]
MCWLTTQTGGRPAPSDEGFASIPASLSPDLPAPPGIQPPPPIIPGALGVVDSSAVPAFSFMEDARPIFSSSGLRTEEIGDYLNRKGIAVRGGHHCAQPILRLFGLESTVRATFALYNTCEEVDALVAALWDLRQGRSTGIV